MAVRESHHRHYHPKQIPLFPLLSLISFISIFLLLSLFRKTSLPPQPYQTFQFINNFRSDSKSSCDYSDGNWFYDPNVKISRYDSTCKEIFKGWNCFSANKSNAMELNKWKWKPKNCDLPQFDPVSFLEKFRDSNIGFVGDSLNRNMFVSLYCSLKRVPGEVKKWRPVGADRGFSFLKYNLTIAYHRTNLLARYGGQLIQAVVNWNLWDIKKDIELMWTFRMVHG